MASESEHLDRRLVVVDDNLKFLILVRGLLREFGFTQVVDFTDPQQAFIYMTQCHVDAALVDLVMPGASGLQLAERIRHADTIVNRVMPIILVTGEVSRKNIQRAIHHGIDEVLAKPFSPRQLHTRLFGLLNRPRVYIKTASGYFGPDRRRREDPSYSGPERRKSNQVQVVTHETLIEMREQARRKYGRLPPSPLEPKTLSPVLVGPMTTIPVAVVKTPEGLKTVARVPTPLRVELDDKAEKARPTAAPTAAPAGAARPRRAPEPGEVRPAAAATPATVTPDAAEGPPSGWARPRVPIAPPPPPKPPAEPEEVHFLD